MDQLTPQLSDSIEKFSLDDNPFRLQNQSSDINNSSENFTGLKPGYYVTTIPPVKCLQCLEVISHLYLPFLEARRREMMKLYPGLTLEMILELEDNNFEMEQTKEIDQILSGKRLENIYKEFDHSQIFEELGLPITKICCRCNLRYERIYALCVPDQERLNGQPLQRSIQTEMSTIQQSNLPIQICPEDISGKVIEAPEAEIVEIGGVSSTTKYKIINGVKIEIKPRVYSYL